LKIVVKKACALDVYQVRLDQVRGNQAEDKQEEKKMTDYTAIPEKGCEDIHFQAESDTDARHWVVNHLDLSKNYSIFKVGA
jgi:hypothetical protein